jgi:hypothetical protein
MGAVLANEGKAMLAPFATSLVIMAIVAALGGFIAFAGLSGRWQRSVASAAG